MTEDNPYEAPTANVVTAGPRDAKQPRGVAFARGFEWFAGGWRYFMASPGPWIGAAFVFLAITVVLSMLPLVGWLSSLLGPVFTAGFVAGCIRQDQGEDFRFDELFAGFRKSLMPLMLVGLLQLVAFFVVFFLAAIAGGALLFAFNGLEVLENPEALLEPGVLMLVLVIALLVMLLTLPILMAVWFAPALVFHGNKSPIEAMLMSLRGCLKNVMPFLAYGLVGLLLLIPIVLTLGLAMVAVFPLATAANYLAYKDIFVYDITVLGHA